jgi:hypothetical protein
VCILALLYLLNWNNINFAFDCGKYTSSYKTFLAVMEESQTRNELDCSGILYSLNRSIIGIFFSDHVIFISFLTMELCLLSVDITGVYQWLRKRLHRCYAKCHLWLHPFEPSHNNVLNSPPDFLSQSVTFTTLIIFWPTA